MPMLEEIVPKSLDFLIANSTRPVNRTVLLSDEFLIPEIVGGTTLQTVPVGETRISHIDYKDGRQLTFSAEPGKPASAFYAVNGKLVWAIHGERGITSEGTFDPKYRTSFGLTSGGFGAVNDRNTDAGRFEEALRRLDIGRKAVPVSKMQPTASRTGATSELSTLTNGAYEPAVGSAHSALGSTIAKQPLLALAYHPATPDPLDTPRYLPTAGFDGLVGLIEQLDHSSRQHSNGSDRSAASRRFSVSMLARAKDGLVYDQRDANGNGYVGFLSEDRGQKTYVLGKIGQDGSTFVEDRVFNFGHLTSVSSILREEIIGDKSHVNSAGAIGRTNSSYSVAITGLYAEMMTRAAEAMRKAIGPVQYTNGVDRSPTALTLAQSPRTIDAAVEIPHPDIPGTKKMSRKYAGKEHVVYEITSIGEYIAHLQKERVARGWELPAFDPAKEEARIAREPVNSGLVARIEQSYAPLIRALGAKVKKARATYQELHAQYDIVSEMQRFDDTDLVLKALESISASQLNNSEEGRHYLGDDIALRKSWDNRWEIPSESLLDLHFIVADYSSKGVDGKHYAKIPLQFQGFDPSSKEPSKYTAFIVRDGTSASVYFDVGRKGTVDFDARKTEGDHNMFKPADLAVHFENDKATFVEKSQLSHDLVTNSQRLDMNKASFRGWDDSITKHLANPDYVSTHEKRKQYNNGTHHEKLTAAAKSLEQYEGLHARAVAEKEASSNRHSRIKLVGLTDKQTLDMAQALDAYLGQGIPLRMYRNGEDTVNTPSHDLWKLTPHRLEISHAADGATYITYVSSGAEIKRGFPDVAQLKYVQNGRLSSMRFIDGSHGRSPMEIDLAGSVLRQGISQICLISNAHSKDAYQPRNLLSEVKSHQMMH